MNTSDLSIVPLKQANLCLDCEMITAAQTHCVACGSAALMNLARTLNGETRTNAAPLALTVASIANGHAFPPQTFRLRQHRRAAAKCVSFPRAEQTVAAGISVGSAGWRRSLREIAAVVQRTVMMAAAGSMFLWIHAGLR